MKEKGKKKINKNVRFNYFEIMLTTDELYIDKLDKELKKINDLKKKDKLSKKQLKKISSMKKIVDEKNRLQQYESSPWDMKEMIEYIKNKNNPNTNIEFDRIIAEIEPNSFIFENNTIISFQLTKLRDNFLLAKKKPGEEKKDLILNDDEYIGEFVSLIYDCKNKIIMLQSNMYGLGVTKVEKYLTLLRRRFLETINDNEQIRELRCELRVVINPNKIDEILKAKYFKKVRVKGSDIMMDSFIDSSGFFGKIRKSIGVAKGLNFDISISANTTDKTKSIEVGEMKKLLDDYKTFEENSEKPLIEITKKDDENSNVELVNLLEPRLTDVINFSIYSRQSIGHDFLYNKMIKTYISRRPLIERILWKERCEE